MTKTKKKAKLPTILIYLFLIFMVVIYLAPVFWIGMTSLKTRPEIYKNPFGWPETLQWGNYKVAWETGKLGIAMLNSLFVCVITLALTMLIGSMAAFAERR